MSGMRQNQSPPESKEEILIICSIINFLLTGGTQIVGGEKEANIKLALKPNNRQFGKKVGRVGAGDTGSQQMVA